MFFYNIGLVSFLQEHSFKQDTLKFTWPFWEWMGLLKTPSWYCSKGLCRRTICIAGSCTAFFKVSVAFLDKKPTDFLIGYGADLLRIFTSSCRCAIEPYLSVSKNKSITLKGNCLRHTFFETQLLNTTFCSRCVFKKHINTTPNANILHGKTRKNNIFTFTAF